MRKAEVRLHFRGGLNIKVSVFYGLVAASVVLLMELLAFLGMTMMSQLRPHLFADAFVDRLFDALTTEDLERYLTEAFDPDLGWDNRPRTEHESFNSIGKIWRKSFAEDGARDDGLAAKALLAAAYGDSFTECAEVDNDQTWPYFLERALGGEVRNFGVGGFGTGQALLKFKRHVDDGRIAPISILAIYEENIGRVVTVYHPFYQRRHGIVFGFKPSFRLGSDGGVESRANPFHDPDLTLAELRAMAKAHAQQDFWGERMMDLGFPYTFELLRALATQLDAIEPAKARRLWRHDEGRRVIAYLIDEFVRIAAAAGSTPLVLFIPHNRSLERSEPPAYAGFVEALSKRYPDLLMVDVVAEAFERDRFNIAPYQGHASEYGNRVIARAIERTLRESSFDRNRARRRPRPVGRRAVRGRATAADGRRVGGDGRTGLRRPQRPRGVAGSRASPPTGQISDAGLLVAAAAVWASAALMPSGAVAQEPGDEWRITIAPYAWLTSLNGDITIGGLKSKLDLDFSDVLENLSLAGMLLAEVQKGRWIVSANFVGARLEADAANSIKVTNDLINLGTAIAYQVVDREFRRTASGRPLSLRLAPLAGARVTYLRVELDIDGGPSVDESETWVDPLIGLRADLDLTERLALFGEADVGGFGVGSDLAWNAQLFLTYRTAVFGVATDLALGYRALQQDYDHGDFEYDVTTFGPIVGAAFHF